MSSINFIFNTQIDTGFQITGVLEFDADLTISEQHRRNADVTDHPIEDGSVISDHVITNPERLTLNGFVTDSQLIILGSNQGRTQDAFDALDTLWRRAEPVNVVTTRKIYQNMIITQLQLPHNAPDSMRFSIDMRSIQIVESNETFIERAQTQDVKDQAQPQQDRGRQTKRTPSTNASDKGQSLIKSIGSGAVQGVEKTWSWL